MMERIISLNTASENFTVDELRVLIDGFSEGDYVRLMRNAGYLVAGTGMDPEELLGEAIGRVLGEDRACPRSLPAVVFLIGVMKSVAWAVRDAARRMPAMESLTASGTSDVVLDLPAPGRSIEDVLIARQDYNARLAALEELFADDTDALLVIMGDADDMPAEEIRELGGFDVKSYATIRKRIRRKIEKEFPGGWVR